MGPSAIANLVCVRKTYHFLLGPPSLVTSRNLPEQKGTGCREGLEVATFGAAAFLVTHLWLVCYIGP